ncbi:MAG: DHA2 family efflux MFS transporter permease subunit [Dehalococcoidales bacterium]
MPDQTKAYRQRWIALAFMGVALLIISLDNTVLNLALPSIAKDLGSSSSQLQWIVDAYVLAIAGLLLTIGYLGDRLGRKPTLMVGLVIFAVFSLGAALSKSNVTLIAMRALMGIGAATIMPATLSILTATFREPKERATAIALWAAVFSLGMGIGPLVGGWLLENYHWSSVFYINIPVIAVGLIGGGIFIANSKSENPRKLDFPGALASIAGMFILVYAIIQAGNDGWTETHVLASFAGAAVLLGGFILWEFKYKNAMLPLKFFKNMSFTGANIALTLVHFGLMGSFFFLGQFLQSVQGFTPLQAGVRLLPMAGVSFVAAIVSASIARLIGTKYTVALGILIAAVGFYYFSVIAAVDVPYSSFVLAMCIVSLGIGFTMAPSTNSIMGSVPVDQSGVGSAVNSTVRQIGGALGVAVLGTILNSTYIADINAVAWPPQLPASAVEIIGGSVQGANAVAQTVQAQSPQLAQLITDTSHRAFTSGSERALVVAAIIMAVSAVLTLFILPNRVRPPQEDS